MWILQGININNGRMEEVRDELKPFYIMSPFSTGKEVRLYAQYLKQ